MHRRDVIRSAALAASGGAISGCIGRGADTGTLSTSIQTVGGDIGDFSNCVLEIEELRALEADEATDTEEHTGAELLYSVGGATVDLVEAASEPVAAFEQSLLTGEYVYLKLVLGGVDAELTTGASPQVKPRDGQTLKFARTFAVRPGEGTRFLAGIRPVQQDNSEAYLLHPVFAESAVTTA